MSIRLERVQPILMSSDISASIQFYELLGFSLSFQDKPSSPTYVVVARDGVVLHLQHHDRGQWACGHDRPAYRFVVQDVDGLYQSFCHTGAVSHQDPARSPWAAPGDTPWGTREFHVLDPDGNGLQFFRPL